MSATDYRELAALFPNETITHSYVQDIELPAANGKPGRRLRPGHARQRVGPHEAHHPGAQHAH